MKKSKSTSTSAVLTRRHIWQLILMFVTWRGFLFVLGAMADQFLSYAPTFPYTDVLLAPSGLPRWFYSWANFDGVHYLTIANFGYDYANLTQAFFPLLPYVLMYPLRMLMGHLINPLIIGLVLTNLCAAGLLITWFAFVKARWGERTAWQACIVLLTFPTSFFFGALYTESLFLMLVLLTFMSAERQRWGLVALFTALATSCRLVGIFLVPALLVEWWQQGNGQQIKELWRNRRFTQLPHLISPLLAIGVGTVGLLGYMAFLWRQYHDPLYFLHVQSEFGAGRQESLILYPQVVWRALKILLTAKPYLSWRYLIYIQEFMAGVVALIGLVGIAPRIRWSYTVFAVGALLLPTVTGTFSSMPRYILVCFPLFLLLTFFVQKWPKLGIVWMSISTVLLLINTVLFIQGSWVA